MKFFIRQASEGLGNGDCAFNVIPEDNYAILELQIEDLIFSIYITNYGPGDFCFSMRTGLDLSSFIHLYKRMEDEHLDLLKDKLPIFMDLILNTASKGSETKFFNKPFSHANDIVNEEEHSWPVKFKILVEKSLDEYITSDIIPMVVYVVKLMVELYDFTDMPGLSKSDLLSNEDRDKADLVLRANNLFESNLPQ